MESNLERKMIAVEEIANAVADGHFTILRFTTCYKGAFGTPDDLLGNEPLTKMPRFSTLADLLDHMIWSRPSW